MAEKRNLILCGFMGTGKSSVGKKLAELTDREFLDMDAVIEAEEGISIPQIFSSRGESAFRKLESNLIDQIAERSGLIVATGGGAIADPQNLAKLKSCGILVTLMADIPTILSRVGSGDDRPMLQATDREERIKSLLDKRAKAYAQADFIINTSSLTIDQVAQEILEYTKKA
jgi:shikimate kinase